jgi:predicted phosphodiesterase
MTPFARLAPLAVLFVGAALVACGSSDKGAADVAVDPGPSPDVQGATPDAAPADAANLAEAAEPDTLPPPDAFQFVKAPWLLNVTADGVTVAWETDVQQADPTVVVTSTAPHRVFHGSSGPLDLSHGPALGTPLKTFQSRVRLEGLEPGSVVTYVVRNADAEQGGTFRAAPGKDSPVHLVAYGDTRIDEDAHRRVVEALSAEAPDVLLHTGDLVHVPTGDALQVFFDVLSIVSRNTPLVATLGNHETDLFRAWFLGFLEPPEGFEDGTNTSFAYGPAYFVMLSSLRDPTREGFAAWLEAELTKAQAWPYRFVVFHHPLHTFSNHAPWDDGRTVIEPLLKQYGVTAVLAGHNHCYERFEVEGIPQLTLGGGGAPLYEAGESLLPEETDLRKASGKFYHYLVLDLTPTEATFRVMLVEPDTVTEFERFSRPPAL